MATNDPNSAGCKRHDGRTSDSGCARPSHRSCSDHPWDEVEDPCPPPARKLARNAQHGFEFYIGLAVRHERKGIRAIRIDAELLGERTSLGQLNRNEAKICFNSDIELTSRSITSGRRKEVALTARPSFFGTSFFCGVALVWVAMSPYGMCAGSERIRKCLEVPTGAL
jgi:hypothetical protein